MRQDKEEAAMIHPRVLGEHQGPTDHTHPSLHNLCLSYCIVREVLYVALAALEFDMYTRLASNQSLYRRSTCLCLLSTRIEAMCH